MERRLPRPAALLAMLAVALLLVACAPVCANAWARSSEPAIISAKADSSHVATVKWKKVKGASKYVLYRSTSKSKGYAKVKSTNALSARSKLPKSGAVYYYKVAAYAKSGKSYKRVGTSPARAVRATGDEEAYPLYYQKILELQEKYGEIGSAMSSPLTYNYLTGLCFARLIDFNDDGLKELLVAYTSSIEHSYDYTIPHYSVRLYGVKDGQVISLISTKPHVGNGYSCGVKTVVYGGKRYIQAIIDDYGDTSRFSGVNDKYRLRSFKFRDNVYAYWEPGVVARINGKKLSKSKYNKFCKEIAKKMRYYPLTYFDKDYSYNDRVHYSRAADELKKTIKVLKRYQ